MKKSAVHINAWVDVVIEPDVLITHRVLLGDEDHMYCDTSVPIQYQGSKFICRVLLEAGCWIGTGVIILPRTHQGKKMRQSEGIRSLPNMSLTIPLLWAIRPMS
ncbi:MAG TPA: hypothetical protein DDZ40_00200 [Deltaproteobacteria bacterium]|nr:hypothetical protein [Deltaproteobacteria bacterium]